MTPEPNQQIAGYTPGPATPETFAPEGGQKPAPQPPAATAPDPEDAPAAPSGPVVIDAEAARKIWDADLKNILKKVKRGQPLTDTERKLIAKRQAEGEQKRQIVDSIRQAAVIMAKPAAVLRAMKKAGCPAFLTGSRVDVTALEKLWPEWAAKLSKAGAGAMGLDDEIKTEKLRKLKLENAELEGQYIDRDELAERLSGLAAKANAILQTRLVVELPPLVAGLDAAAIRTECEKIHARICADFKNFAAEWSKPPTQNQ